MNLRWGTIVLVAGLFATGCGTDEELEARQEQGRATQEAYAPIQAEIVGLGNDVGAAVQESTGQAGKRVADRFEALSERMSDQADRIRSLDAPASEVPERDELAAALDRTAGTLDEVADAAADDDVPATAEKLQELIANTEPVVRAQNRFEGALRSLVGSG